MLAGKLLCSIKSSYGVVATIPANKILDLQEYWPLTFAFQHLLLTDIIVKVSV